MPHGRRQMPAGAAKRTKKGQTSSMCNRRLTVTAALCLPLAARAGIIDWFNGVTVGKPLPTHDIKFLGATPDPAATLQLIDFGATWCAPCRDAIPKLNALHQKYASRGLSIIGVTQEKQELVERFTKTVPFHYPVGLDVDGELHESLRIIGLPYALFVGRDHMIVWRGAPAGINDALIERLLKEAGTRS